MRTKLSAAAEIVGIVLAALGVTYLWGWALGAILVGLVMIVIGEVHGR